MSTFTSRSESRSGAQAKQWHYQPDLPIGVSPLFTSPLRLKEIALWFTRAWLPVSERLIILILSLCSWLFWHPALERCYEFNASWILQIFFRNLALMILVAGGLHLYLYVLRRQRDERHFDSRPFATNNKGFTFNDQVKDNMFWTCVSGVTIWSAYEVIMMWSLANGYLPTLSGPYATLWLVLLIMLVPIWETFYFYLIHRLLHMPALYRIAHHLHHRNTNVGPWSGLSMHPLEHVLYLGSVLIHWIVAAHPLLIIYHLQYYTLSAATTHCGYEGLQHKGTRWLSLGTYHHQLHHRYFECNYGGLEIPWDRWAGSFHDGTEQSHSRFLNQRRSRKSGK